jgi:hypothetical protein
MFELAPRGLGLDIRTDVEAEHFGLTNRPAELFCGYDAAQVGDRARGCGHWDSLAASHIGLREGARSVAPDARALSAPAAIRDRDVDRSRCGRQQSPNGCCGPVAENSSIAASQHGRHPSAVLAQPGMADGVHTAMDPMQAPDAKPATNTTTVDSRVHQLGNGDHPTLPDCDPRHNRVRWCAFGAHRASKAHRRRDSPRELTLPP